ncbi:MAG: hypothetical protein J1F63_07370 [Oscillospiraceae bacterium]|nr:hypothetical protein [Oscillospiraceae bacterium]
MRIQNRGRGRGFAGCLEIVAAAFILLGPTVINTVCRGWGLYAAFAAVTLCFAVRLLENGGIHMTVDIGLGVLTLVYALLAIIWADNLFLHIRYVFTILTVVGAMFLAADYFSVGKEKGLSERLLYMIIFSAEICALWNLIYWAFLSRFSMTEPMSAGMGQSDLLGMYMAVGLWCAAKAGFGRKLKKISAFILALPMIFVLFMSRSALSWFLVAGFAAVYLFKNGRKLVSFVFAAAAAASGVLLVVWSGGTRMTPFLDALLSVLRRPEGLGGGGFFARQTQFQSVAYTSVNELGTGASLASSLGILGLFMALVFIGRHLWLTYKYKDWLSAFTVILGIYSFFTPVGSGLAGLILLMSVSVYGEWRLGRMTKVRVPVVITAIICCTLAAAVILGCVLAVSEGFRRSGMKNMFIDERKAFEQFSMAASINPFDDESCYNAANALRHLYEQNGDREDAVNAEYYIKRAIERNEYSALYHIEYARLMKNVESYARAVEENDRAVKLAPLNDDYKVNLGENLYLLMQTYERGSVDTQRCYQRILDCADVTSDMDKKKIIIDWADKAQPYTRIDYFGDLADSDTDNTEPEEDAE